MGGGAGGQGHCLNKGGGLARAELVGLPPRLKKFVRDIEDAFLRLSQDLPPELKAELEALKDKLIWLKAEGKVKINHSVMELVCAKELLAMGYSVDVEHEIGGLVCDVYAELDGRGLVVEIETGFVPPEHALDPMCYCKARIASKIARYGSLSDGFALALPPHYVALVPAPFLVPGDDRSEEDLLEIKELCDYYYHNPPVSLDEIRSARLDWVLIIDVDNLAVKIMDPRSYREASLRFLRSLGQTT